MVPAVCCHVRQATIQVGCPEIYQPEAHLGEFRHTIIKLTDFIIPVPFSAIGEPERRFSYLD